MASSRQGSYARSSAEVSFAAGEAASRRERHLPSLGRGGSKRQIRDHHCQVVHVVGKGALLRRVRGRGPHGAPQRQRNQQRPIPPRPAAAGRREAHQHRVRCRVVCRLHIAGISSAKQPLAFPTFSLFSVWFSSNGLFSVSLQFRNWPGWYVQTCHLQTKRQRELGQCQVALSYAIPKQPRPGW